MKPFPVFQILTAACAFLTITSCQENTQTPDAVLQTLIKEQVDSLYSVYPSFDYDWIDFYQDRFTAIYPESPVKLNSKDSLSAQWESIYKDFDVQLLYSGQPNIIASEDMAISYSSFNEIFINKQGIPQKI